MRGKFRFLHGASLTALIWGVSAGAASAEPISAFIVSTIGLTGPAAAIATVVVDVALSLGLSSILSPKPPKSQIAERQASILELSIGETPAEVILGGACTGGGLVDTFCYGPDNIWEVRVIRLADCQITGLDGFFVNDKFYLFTGNGYVGGDFAEGVEQFLYVEFHDGRPGQPASAFLQSASSQSDLPAEEWWTADDKMTGRAYVVMAYRINDKIWASGRPAFKFVCRGAPVYDPRKDSTVPGGSGPHRWGQPWTYEYSENALVNSYNYRRGIWNYAASPAQLICGPGKSAEEQPPELEIAGMNACDETINVKAGWIETRYRIGAVIRANEMWGDINRDFEAAMAGRIAQRQGGLTIDPGVVRSVVKTFTDADLMVGEKVRLSSSVGRDLLVNSVTAKFVNPYQLWQDSDAPVRRSQDDIDADGEIREYSLPLRFVTSQSQAQRIAEIYRRRARLMHSGSVVLHAEYMGLEAGDWVGWTSERYFAGETRYFEVQGTSEPRIGRIALALAEVSSAAFGWSYLTDELDFQAPVYLAAGAPAPLQLGGIVVSPGQTTAADGAPKAVVMVSWTPPAEQTLRQVIAEIRVKDGDLLGGVNAAQRTTFAGADLIAAQNLRLQSDLLFETAYEVRLVPVPEPGRVSLASDWYPVTTPEVILPVVTGLTATPAADGALLEWDPAARIDVIGYAVRKASSPAAAWADAEIVSVTTTLPRIFAPIATKEPVSFFVRALDREGRESQTSAVVTTKVIPPASVTRFNAYPNGDLVRFTWDPIDAQVRYEIRSGETWDQGSVVDIAAGASTQAQWPVRLETDSLFWLKALSAAGLYSETPILAVGRQLPVLDRNDVETRDFFTEGWTGFKYDLTASGGGGVLELDAGKNRGDYYDRISLIDSFYARYYIDQRAASILQESPTWAEATGTWADADRPWMELLGDSGTARVESWISIPEDSPSSRIEAWPFENDTLGLISTNASPVIHVSHGPCRIGDGVEVGNSGLLAASIAIPAVFSLLVDFRATETPAEDWTILTFADAAGHWLQLWYDFSAEAMILEDQNGVACAAPCSFAAGESLAFGIWQSAGRRGLGVGVRAGSGFKTDSVAVAGIGYDSVCFARAGLGPQLTWADVAALGWTWADVGPGGEFSMAWSAAYANVGPTRKRARGRFGEVDLRDSALPGQSFASEWEARGRIGYSQFQPLVVSNYQTQYADIWMRLTAPSPDGQTLAISRGFVTVDVPDVIDGSGEAGVTVPDTGLDVSFARPFYRIPSVVPGFASGSELGIAKVTAVTRAGFHIQIFKASAPAVPMAGVARWVAKGF